MNRFDADTSAGPFRFQAETINQPLGYKVPRNPNLQQPGTIQLSVIDARILALIRAGGSEAAFECLTEHYEGSVYRLCYAILKDAAQAEDAAQEALIRVWKALPRFDGRAALSTWIYAIARNRCLTALTRRRDHLSLSEPDVAAAADTALPAAADHVTGAGLLRELVDALPERYRRALTLYYYNDCSVTDVATQLGVPAGTVKTNLYRARAALHAQLGRLGITDVSQGLEPMS
jgi:RNA polymerase sigma-70 factor (ECF subfamily)